MDLAEYQQAALEYLAKETGRSPEEVLRRAIGTQQYIVEAERLGKTILVEDRHGRISKLVF